MQARVPQAVLARGVVLLALLALAACSQPAAPKVPGTRTPAPSPSVASLPAPDPMQPASIMWLQVSQMEVDDVTLGVELILGRGDGSVVWSGAIPLDPSLANRGFGFVSGPRAGIVAYGVPGESGTSIRVVSGPDGSEREVLLVELALLTGSVDPLGRWVYFITAEADGSASLTRMPVEGGEPEPVADVEVGRHRPDPMHWTPDGSRLLIESCAPGGACWWQVLDVESGELSELRGQNAGALIDLTNDTVLAQATDCTVGPCAFTLVDLASAEARPFDPGAHEARLAIDEAGRTVVLYDNQGLGFGASRITALDMASGEERVVYESPDRGGGYGLAREGQGWWAPRGWFLVAPAGLNVGEGQGPVLIRIADGHVVELPQLDRQ